MGFKPAGDIVQLNTKGGLRNLITCRVYHNRRS